MSDISISLHCQGCGIKYIANAVVVVVLWQQDKNGKEAREDMEGKSGSMLLLFYGNKIKMARKPGKICKENLLASTGERQR